MVAPLRTWQHMEPKGLWPTLGGLAVVAHIGVLGLSLPYVAGLIQGGGGGGLAVVPIELLDVSAEAAVLTATATTSGDAPGSLSPAEPAEPVRSTPAVSAPPVVQAPSEVVTVPAEPVAEEASQPVPEAERPSDNSSGPAESAAPVDNTDNGDQDERPPAESPETETPADDASTPAGGSTEGEDPVSSGGEAAGPPALNGDPLPMPGSTSAGGEADQIAALSIDTHAPVPDEYRRDLFAVTLPVPNGVSSVAMRPQDVNCGRVVELSTSQLTYRITVSANGTILFAEPWTGSNEARSLNADEKAVECLLQQAFSFTPAYDEYGAIANSDLLLTFTLDLRTD